jgi:hypothetical protein
MAGPSSSRPPRCRRLRHCANGRGRRICAPAAEATRRRLAICWNSPSQQLPPASQWLARTAHGSMPHQSGGREPRRAAGSRSERVNLAHAGAWCPVEEPHGRNTSHQRSKSRCSVQPVSLSVIGLPFRRISASRIGRQHRALVPVQKALGMAARMPKYPVSVLVPLLSRTVHERTRTACVARSGTLPASLRWQSALLESV